MSDIFQDIIKKNQPYLIAEIGVNYFDIAQKNNITLIDAAKLMIDEAKRSGADAVKFQSYKAEGIAIKNAPAYWDTKKEPSKNQFELFSKFDTFKAEDYQCLAAHSKKKEIMFLSTPFDFEAVDYLDELCPLFKISSSDITNWPFLEYIAQKNKPIFLSTGASNMEEINEAFHILNKHGNGEVGLLHCVLNYPTAYKNANLNMIKHLKREFKNCMIGYSDHTLPDATMTCLITAVDFGAVIIEKHFTLDKSLPGNDHYHAMDPNDVRMFKNNLKNPEFKGDANLILLISGEQSKYCLPCENIARLNARRSIVANKTIRKGTSITRDMLTFKRPGTGISPKDIDTVISHVAIVDIKNDTQLKLTDLKS